MLVYLKEPMAYTSLEGFRVYGKQYCRGKFGPVDLPREVYELHKDKLEDAEYTSRWLTKKFGKVYQGKPFRVSNLRDLDFDTLISIALFLDIKYARDGRVEPSIKEKNAIIKSILSRL